MFLTQIMTEHSKQGSNNSQFLNFPKTAYL